MNLLKYIGFFKLQQNYKKVYLKRIPCFPIGEARLHLLFRVADYSYELPRDNRSDKSSNYPIFRLPKQCIHLIFGSEHQCGQDTYTHRYYKNNDILTYSFYFFHGSGMSTFGAYSKCCEHIYSTTFSAKNQS